MKHDDLSRTMKIKSNLSRSLRDERIECLRSHVDMFAGHTKMKYKYATQGGVNWDSKNYLILKQIIMQI